MSALKDQDIEKLLSLASDAKINGGSLCEVFSKFSKDKNLAKGTVRNIYYDILKKAETDESLKEKYPSLKNLKAEKIIEFDKVEARWLLKKILLGSTFGKPVRRIVNELTDDPKKALRYQNKYRNMLKSEKDLVDEVIGEIKAEYGKCFDPYEKHGDDALSRLKNEINDLYARISQDLRNENQRLKMRISYLESENERLRGKQINSAPLKDYFENIDMMSSKFVGGKIHKEQ